jgi:hypothetical protein
VLVVRSLRCREANLVNPIIDSVIDPDVQLVDVLFQMGGYKCRIPLVDFTFFWR